MAEPSTAVPVATDERNRLLATKLYIPRPRPGFLVRPRLLECLTNATTHELTLISAPAGFGKTSLLGDWARRTQQPVAWLSLDGGDSEPVRFWRYVAAALETTRPGMRQRVDSLFQGGQAPLETVLTAVINELVEEPGEVVLVLDDYHLIESPSVHDSLVFLLERLPRQLRLVLATRADPPLPLARLRARAQLVEIRVADLRFTEDEAAAVLHTALGTDLPEDTVTTLAVRTEGWAAGLQLAALSLRGHRDPAGFVAAFSGSHRHVLDYLTEEVLARQPQHLIQFLLETSILERVSGPLCDAVTGRADSQQLLEQIERANLFLIPLDQERRWWRYHQLFADVLRTRLQNQQHERVAALHRAAGAWWEANGLAEQALHHALAAGDAAWVARLTEHSPELLWVGWPYGEDPTVTRWREEPPGLMVQEPWLCVALATRAAMAGRLEEAEQLLAASERSQLNHAGTPQQPPTGAAVRLVDDLPSIIAMMRANFARVYGDPTPATRFARALAGMAGEEPLTRAVVDWNTAQADLLSGQLGASERALTRSIAGYRAAGVPLQAAATCYDLAQVQHAQGRLGAAMATCREALELVNAVDSDLPPAAAARVRLAELLRERNELDVALERATKGIELCRRLEFAWPLAAGLATLSWIRQAHGDCEGAREAMGEAERALPDARVVALFNPAPTEGARLALAQGNVDAAVRWVRARDLSANDEPSYQRENEYLVLVRVLLATQAPAEALGLLARLHARAVAQERTGSVIKVRTLQALALSASGDQAGALDALTEAIMLGASEGYLRVFVDEGPPMAALLRQLVMSRRQERAATAAYRPSDHLARLLDAFEQAGLPIRPPVRGGVVAAGLVEPLSNRELEVLRQLAAGASNKVIAKELVITLDTVKRHVSHLFSKLEVSSRTQAVARARELGLLP